ncbi:MAG: phosphoenolpyruvate--protein phosphotransferase [Chloroflexota bacterium]
MRSMHGVAAAPGQVRGGWARIQRSPILTGGRIPPDEVAAERLRLGNAIAAAALDLEGIAERVAAEGHGEEAAIFAAQAAIALDPALVAMSEERIGRLDDAVTAIQAAAESFADQLRSLGDELLAARAADVTDVGHRIARHLAGRGMEPEPGLDRPAIVVADDLPPSVTATLPRERLLGICLEGSSATAHAAILARAYGIPAVVGVPGLLAALRSVDDARGAAGSSAAQGLVGELAIDGDTGEVVLDPDEATQARFDRGASLARRRHEVDIREAALPAVTSDGVEVTLLANIGTPDECGPAVELGARGVGLFRTEFLFLERASPPTEAEQLAAYRRVVEAFAPHPVTIRLLDVGGDKPIPYLPIPTEANPFLGVRALRLARTDPAVFITQLRACYRAALAGPVKVMAPMVADASDAALLLDLAAQTRRALAEDGLGAGEVALGVMLEIPSAILVGDTYFGQIAFASLGTNDLLQYALAVDRGNAALERYRDTFHPALLRLIHDAVLASSRAGIDLSVCGEMAGDPAAALALAGLGVRQLSMAASSLPLVRRAIRAVSAGDLDAAARVALDDSTAADARARFTALLPPAVDR